MKERSAGAVCNLEEKPKPIGRKKEPEEVPKAAMMPCGNGFESGGKARTNWKEKKSEKVP